MVSFVTFVTFVLGRVVVLVGAVNERRMLGAAALPGLAGARADAMIVCFTAFSPPRSSGADDVGLRLVTILCTRNPLFACGERPVSTRSQTEQEVTAERGTI